MNDKMIRLRCATPHDAAALEAMQWRAMRALAWGDYDRGQISAFLRHLGTLDRELIEAGTLLLAEARGRVVASAGWSARDTLHRVGRSGDLVHGTGRWLDPAHDAAVVRTVFVDPGQARRGLGRRLTLTAMAAARGVGFTRYTLLATLTGERLYRALGFESVRRSALLLPGGHEFPVVEMRHHGEAAHLPAPAALGAAA